MDPWWSMLPTILLLHLFLIWPSLPPSMSVNYTKQYEECVRIQYPCGNKTHKISYPFRFHSHGRPDFCGRPGYDLDCDEDESSLMLRTEDKQYRVHSVDYSDHSLIISVDYSDHSLTVRDLIFDTVANCSGLLTGNNNMDLSPFEIGPGIFEVPVIRCTSVNVESLGKIIFTCFDFLEEWYFYYSFGEHGSEPYDSDCETAHVWMNQTTSPGLQSSSIDLFDALGEGFTVTWKVEKSCDRCTQRGGICTYDDTSGREDCVCSYGLCQGKGHDNKTSTAVGKGHDNNTSIAIGVGVGGGFVALLIGGLLLLYKHRKRKLRSSTILLSRTGSIDSSVSKEDPELGTYPELGVSRYRTYVFTFEELHEATGGFSESNELGDGGFGTVYKGVLRDGRVVAVKRLYQQNCRRLEQFMNEVDIISDLRHPNLVMLYGCTSRRSRDLLLVYEYVSNGTVADHLYGVQADAGFLTWPTRMSIAVQTADALAYLHDDGIQIIHRDVKTSNILLGDHFHVKVADFGLSRLFPADATHVSTAPQGTPGYLDPEYHQCYQLTDKSDVYSFGVVLAELISSKPAVDLTRQRSEINLSSMAINKILNQEMDQFVDPRLGYQSDLGTREMIDSVAELAFRCLQLESDMRPTMKEVLGVLRGIRSRGTGAETRGMDPDVEAKEDAHLLKNAPLYSPSSVVERWASVATTPNASG